jgi:hypothetical protein
MKTKNFGIVDLILSRKEKLQTMFLETGRKCW